MKSAVRVLANRSAWAAYGFSRSLGWARALQAFVGRLYRFPLVVMGSRVKLVGMRGMRIGRNSVIASGSWLNVNQVQPEQPTLTIGENCFIGQDNFFSVGRRITIRDYCLTARYCSFIGSAHIYADPFKPYLKTGTTDSDSIYIGVNCFFGLRATVIGNVRIGHGCVIGAGTEVRSDIPPYSLVAGSPARVLRRYDMRSHTWVKWPADDFAEGPCEEEYLAMLQASHRWLIQPVSAALPSHDVM
jgi:acetyltransferase-like isoleucine patch superfamily enzyme